MIENRLNLRPVYRSVIYKVSVGSATFKLLVSHNPNKHKRKRFAFKLYSEDPHKIILRKSGLGSERTCIKLAQDLLIPKRETLYTKEKDINNILFAHVYRLVMRRLRGNAYQSRIEENKLRKVCIKYNKKYIDIFDKHKGRAQAVAREFLYEENDIIRKR